MAPMTMPPSVPPFVPVSPMANQAVFLDQWNTVGRILCNFQSVGWKRCCSFLLLLFGNSALTASCKEASLAYRRMGSDTEEK